MKKLLCAAAAICMLFALAACGGKGDGASPNDVTGPDKEDIYSGEYVDPDIGETALRISKKDDGAYDVYISIFRLTALDDGTGRVEDDGLRFTATDASGNPISGVIVPVENGMKVTFTGSTWSLLENGTSFTYTVKEGSDEDGQNPVMNFIGEYVCGRARALVECSGREDARVTIQWGNSARSLSSWVMTGKLDTETLKVEYSDCVKSELTFSDKGEVAKATVEYENGKGYFVFGTNSAFTWHDDTEKRDDMTFEWTPPAAE